MYIDWHEVVNGLMSREAGFPSSVGGAGGWAARIAGLRVGVVA